MISSRVPGVAALALFAALSGCRCAGGGCNGVAPKASGDTFVWAESRDLSDVPTDGVSASLLGAAFSVGHVQLREAPDGSARLEITDLAPEKPCGPVPGGQGFSVKVPGPLKSGMELHKSMADHPRDVSAFMVQRQDQDTSQSVMAGSFSLSLKITHLDREAGVARGAVSLMFDDVDHSGAAGTFVAELCAD